MSWKGIGFVILCVVFPPLGLLALLVWIEAGVLRLISGKCGIDVGNSDAMGIVTSGFAIRLIWTIGFFGGFGFVAMGIAGDWWVAVESLVMSVGALVALMLSVLVVGWWYAGRLRALYGSPSVDYWKPAWLTAACGAGLGLLIEMGISVTCMASGGC